MKVKLLDLIFPKFCLGCGYVGAYLCLPCELKMKKVKKTCCFYCEKPSLFGLTHPKCRQKKGIDGYLSIYLYEGLFKKLLHESKYKGAYGILRTLLRFPQQKIFQNLDRWSNLFKPKIISVPLHPQRIKERGFNQSEIITEHYFSSLIYTNTNHDINCLERKINTKHLANITNKYKRKLYIKGAFAFTGKDIPKSVLLIDDVITSGSTILECSKVLKENGVQTVLAFSLAKG